MLSRFLPAWANALTKEIFSISFDLYKLMIPIILLVKIIEELGGIEYISMALSPLMQWLGLPASMGLVWAATMLTNIYAGMIIFVSMPTDALSVAQVTVLGSMMLVAHSLPIELRVVQKVGVRLLYTLLLRVASALLLGFLLHHIYSAGDYLSQANQSLWNPIVAVDPSIGAWLLNQLKILFQIFWVIAALVVFLKLLKLSGIEKLFIVLLKPILKLLGLSEKTASISIIGMTLGLTYGGGLLIHQAKQGNVSKLDLFGAMSLLSICHGLIEDTLLIMLLGADLSGILFARVLFSIILIALLVRIVRRFTPQVFTRYVVYPAEDK